MQLSCFLNGTMASWEVTARDDLATFLRRIGLYGVKVGCGTGECGSCLVLLDGLPIIACTTPVETIQGKDLTTIEGLGDDSHLHPLQNAFLKTCAVQCGFCTPAMILAAKALLDSNPKPRESDVRKALHPILCRCGPYKRPVRAILSVCRERGAAENSFLTDPAAAAERSVKSSSPAIDGPALVRGAPVFTDDISLPDMLFGKILWSPHAHAIIRGIDTQKASRLPGVHAVLSHKNVARVSYTRAGQDYPEPSPYDYFVFDNKVRYIGDRVAAVAAESSAIAQKAISLIEVDYQVLKAALYPAKAARKGSPIIHDESEAERISDYQRNICAKECVVIGNPDTALHCSDFVIDHTYHTHRTQHAQLEPHVCYTYYDPVQRLVIRSGTQVPFHVRRVVARLLGIPETDVRVIVPRIGGGFGSKQELVLEDVCALLTQATSRPVRLALDRREEFVSARCRHPMEIRLRSGCKRTGELLVHDMQVVADAGAYGSHSPTVARNTGAKNLPRYPTRSLRFSFEAVYTNNVISGAFRGYGTPQGAFAIESQVDEIAHALNVDPVDYRLRVCIRSGDSDHLSPHFFGPKALRDVGWKIVNANLDRCLVEGAAAFGWTARRKECEDFNRYSSSAKRGVGVACVSQGTGVAGTQRVGVRMRLEDQGVSLYVGLRDIGTGSDTVLVQMAAEALGLRPGLITLVAGDTDTSPFSSGVYASGTTYLAGNAIRITAEHLLAKVYHCAGNLLRENPADLKVNGPRIVAPTGREVGFRDVLASAALQNCALEAERVSTTEISLPPFAAQFVEIEVHCTKATIRVLELLSVVDAGTIINPAFAECQVEGAVLQGLGFALHEELRVSAGGKVINPTFRHYRIWRADEIPALRTIFLTSEEPLGPFGAKAVAEIGINGPAPAIANALHHALGVRMRRLPITPARLRSALRI